MNPYQLPECQVFLLDIPETVYTTFTIPMLVEQLNGLIAVVLNYQSTYLLLEVGTESIRVDFLRKKEFSLHKGANGTITLSSSHPILFDYNEGWASTYINSKAALPDQLEFQIKSAIDNITESCRSWLNYVPKRYLIPTEILRRNLREGNGLLLNAPISVAQEVTRICNEHEVQTKTFAMEASVTPHKVLCLETSYVIAEDFKLKL